MEGQLLKTFNDLLVRVGVTEIRDVTVEDWLTKWVSGKDESTAKRYGHSADVFMRFLDRKAKGPLEAITYNDILGFIDSRQKEGVAPKTISIDVKSLNNAFNIAERTQIISNNPIKHALAIRPIKIETSEKHPFTDAQVRALLRVAQGDWKTMVMLGYYTGARIGDCSNMQWRNIKINNGITIIDYIAEKTGEPVVVPVHPALESYLQNLRQKSQKNFICPTLAGKGTGGAHGLSSTFSKLMVKAGIDAPKIEGKGLRKFSPLSFHSFRHTFTTNLGNNNVNQETRMALTGHKTESVNSGYTHLNLPTLNAAIAKLSTMNEDTV
ncbi:MAG: integrase family protein [Verrucomicrobiales bacterium]|nr:integrase family protein [Verrucomicrobiales bacterium]